MLKAGGLDYLRLVRKLDQLLEAKRVAHYQGEEVGAYDDGSVQARAAELLAELLGLRKGQLDLNVEGSLSFEGAIREAYKKRSADSGD